MVDKSRSRAEGGAGLGLALCKEIEDVAGGLEAAGFVQVAGTEHIRVADDGCQGGFQLVDKTGKFTIRSTVGYCS